MNLHGKGEQLRNDITKIFDPKLDKNKALDELTTKYGEEVKEILYDNFILPIAKNIKDLDVVKKLSNSLDLFCAAFTNPIK